MTNAEKVLTCKWVEDSTHARILADSVNTEVVGMVAENTRRESCGNALAYGEEAFFLSSDALLHIAEMLGGKLGEDS